MKNEDFPLVPKHAEVLKKIERELKLKNPDRIEHLKRDMYYENIGVLVQEKEWLNNHVIDYYMELLKERSKENEKLPILYAMECDFYHDLSKKNLFEAMKFTKTVYIFDCDLVLVPINISNNHWTLAVISMKEKAIKYYDSQLKTNDYCLDRLAMYLKNEKLKKEKIKYNMKGWKLIHVKNIPRQPDSYNCGVFLCMYAEFIARNRPLTKDRFEKKDMTRFRSKMLFEIWNEKLLN